MDLIGKPRSKSVVWMYFGFRADENGFPLRSDEVICRLCRKIVLAKGGNTTNLRSHLKRRHRAEIANSPFSASLGVGPDTSGDEEIDDSDRDSGCNPAKDKSDPEATFNMRGSTNTYRKRTQLLVPISSAAESSQQSLPSRGTGDLQAQDGTNDSNTQYMDDIVEQDPIEGEEQVMVHVVADDETAMSVQRLDQVEDVFDGHGDMDNPDGNKNASEKPPGKRKKHSVPKKWKQNVTKEKRLGGEANQDRKGKEREGKTMGPPCVSHHCKMAKDRDCQNLTEEQRRWIFDRFWSLESWEERQLLVRALAPRVKIKQKTKSGESRRETSFKYYLQGEGGLKTQVCKSLFASTLGLSLRTISHWTSDLSESTGGEAPDPEVKESEDPKQVLDQSHEELIQELQSLSAQADSSHNYVPDAVLPPGEPWMHGGPSRAALSLPSCLSLSEYSRPHSPTSESYIIDMKVFARCHLQVGIMFGPYIGEMCKGHVPDNLKYAWAIRDESAFVYVDGSDSNRSNWMRFVTFTSCEDEHNLTVFQFYRKIYYKVSQPISEGDELKVWVGRDYASLLGLDYTGENMKCQVGEKESFLRPLQDIQLVTLPEPAGSALWSDHSQSQSPMPIISEVTSMNTGGGSGHSSPAVPSSSLGYLPSQHPFENKYHFLPGTERLVSNPDFTNAAIYSDQSLWYFFGFEPDHAGRPLDRTTAICKLCGDHVNSGGGIHEIKSHLKSKHQIKQRETTITSCQRPSAVPRPFVPVSAASSVTVTDSILYFLITDLQPPSFVRGKGFQHLISSLLPHVKELPSKTKLEFLLNELYAKSKTNMVQMLKTNTDALNYMAPLETEQVRRKREVPHLVNFSVDVWFHTWQGNTEMYLSLWAHYLDASFTCHNRALLTQKLSKSGLNLKSVESQVRAMGEEWGITQANLSVLGGEGWDDIRVVPMRSEVKAEEPSGSNTHPNSTTFLGRDDSTSPVERDAEPSETPSEGPPSVPCFFTAVQSCIDELMTMNAVSKVLSKFQNIVAELFGDQSQITGSNNEIYATQLSQVLTKEEQVEVKVWAYSRPTWNKLYLLLNTLLKHRGILRGFITKLREDTSCESSSSSSSENLTPTGSSQSMRAEWKVVEDLCLVLKPLDVACQTLAKEDFPRLSLIKPILTGLLTRHLVTRPGDSPVLKEAKTMMRYNLSHWYDAPTVNRVLNVACALDPQFHGLGFMSEQDQTDTFHWLKREAVRISNEPKKSKRSQQQHKLKRSPSPSSPDESRRRSKRLKDTQPINFRDLDGSDIEECENDTDDSEWVEPVPEDGLSGMEFLLGDLYSSGNKSKQRSVEESVEMELNMFRADNGACPGVEPLQWWKTKTMQLPLLSAVAQAYLSAPAVAGSAAQCYSQEGAGATRGKRSNIPPENLDAILFLHHNNIQKIRLKLY